ncbi:MAG: hypothetical protein R2813_12300 [Flavobacteriales bacterium]
MISFPVYRKYSNGKSLFKIISETRFDELKLTGKLVQLHEFEAKIYPDRQLIQDMIEMKNGFWEESSETEFQSIAQ